VEKVDEFSAWVDPLWQETRSAYAMTAVRDSATLRTLYAASDQHFTRLRIRRNGSDIGWAVVGERRKDEKYGAMRVGSIVDCWASPEDALPVLRAAADALEQSGYDLIVSNQSHHQWGRALEQCGFLQADSNFIFAASKGLAALLQPFDKNQSLLHFTRADGDGLPRNF
jgi:FMN phosphatase YigB (HAD superfamily)